MTDLSTALRTSPLIRLEQQWEPWEFLGFETRNKYQISNAAGQPLGFIAEERKGWLAAIFRQFLGHWRRFDLVLFAQNRMPLYRAHHPFRWFFQRLELRAANQSQYIGALQQRFSIFTKKFDVEDAQGRVVLQVASPFWRIWTFPFHRPGLSKEVAVIRKKWKGILGEAFTDADRFTVEFSPETQDAERLLLVAAAVFIDLQYFERKGSGGGLSSIKWDNS